MFDFIDAITKHYVEEKIDIEVDDSLFDNPMPITIEDDKPESILCASRDYVKRDSLMRVIRDVVSVSDLDDYKVDNYNRQQVVLDELSFDSIIDLNVDDIVFPEVGAERLTTKKLSALTVLSNKGVVAARNNEHILTHCVECDLAEEEAVVFGIKMKGREDFSYFRWYRDRVCPIASNGPCWLRCFNGKFINMTISVECADTEPPDYCFPSFNPRDSYYVWIDGMVYLLPSSHVFSFKADGEYLYDKNNVRYASTREVGLVLATPEGRIISASHRPPDSSQIIKSMMLAGVTTSDIVSKFPVLAHEGYYIVNPNLKVYIREFPDTLVTGFQLIGASHTVMTQRLSVSKYSKPRVVMIGHTMYPPFNGENRYVKINGKIYTRKRIRGGKKVVVSNNKYGVPSGTWYEV